MKGDDYSSLQDTYPVHPLSLEPRRYIDKEDMLEQRKARNFSELDEQKKRWDLLHPSHVD